MNKKKMKFKMKKKKRDDVNEQKHYQ